MLKDGNLVAVLASVVSVGLIGASMVALLENGDARLTLTYWETFSNLSSVRDVFYNARNYTVRDNPLGTSHVGYSAYADSQQEVDDLIRRGLIDTSVWTNTSGLVVLYDLLPYRLGSPANLFTSPYANLLGVLNSGKDLLTVLMRTSWCSSGPPLPGTFPANRTPGCKCISDAYLAFIKETLPLNASALSVVNASQDVRKRIGDQVYRCWDQRQVRLSRTCGQACTTHAAGLALFANIVLLLACISFILFRWLDWNIYLIKLVVLLIAVALSIPFIIQDARANALNLAGVAVCLFYLLVGLHRELNMQRNEPSGPHPLILCVLVNLPLILSAHTIQLGVGGHARDVWATESVGVCGAIMGVILQVFPDFLSTCFARHAPDFSLLAAIFLAVLVWHGEGRADADR
jgi:hypothetical protein